MFKKQTFLCRNILNDFEVSIILNDRHCSFTRMFSKLCAVLLSIKVKKKTDRKRKLDCNKRKSKICTRRLDLKWDESIQTVYGVIKS